MEPVQAERRLAAILAADIVGYSRLIEKDEAGTLAAIRKLRAEVIDPLLASHRGRIVKLMGDGALVEFGSVVDAVSCAVAVQKETPAAQTGVSADRRIAFRIGINLGDVVVEGDDLLGDGVNIAARLEQLCDPGGVLISGTAFDHLRGKLGLPLDFAGDQKVKNIAEPVRAYRVRLAGGSVPWRLRLRQHRRNLALATAAVVVLAIGGGSALWLWPTEKANAKPAIAVLPFDSYGVEGQVSRLADGITEDIITDLARFRILDVIARNSTEVYSERQVDIRQIGRELNVDYVLEGSIQQQGNDIRTTAQLIDAQTGTHVWSDRWDRPVEDIFAVQSEISETIAGMLGSNLITRIELERASRLRPTDLEAYQYFLMGHEIKRHPTRETIPKGIEYLNQAIALDPSFARAYNHRAWLNFIWLSYSGDDADTLIDSFIADAEKAVRLDPQYGEGVSTLAFARLIQGRYAEAEKQIRLALELSPADSHVVLAAAFTLACLGLPDEGSKLADRAFRLDPHMPSALLSGLKDAYYMARRYEDVIATVDRAPEEERLRDMWLMFAVSHARLGHEKEASDAVAKLLQAHPNVSAERMLNEDYGIFAREEDRTYFVDGFRTLQLPVCMKPDEVTEFERVKAVPECEAERSKAAVAR